MNDVQRLLRCFDPPPLPVKSANQSFQPTSGSWFELKFLYKVVLPDPLFNKEHEVDRAMFKSDVDPFFVVKAAMMEDEVWGIYREHWFATMFLGEFHYYFMTRAAAMRFCLWVSL
jgi:hypothetical protein